MVKMSLAKINEFRAAHGLPAFTTDPTVMRPGKTARKSKSQQNANAAARAQANRDMKAVRTTNKKGR